MRPDAIDWTDKTNQVALHQLPRSTMHLAVWRWLWAAIATQAGLALLILGSLQGPWRTDLRPDHASALAQLAADQIGLTNVSRSARESQAALDRIASNPAVSFADVVDGQGSIILTSGPASSRWMGYRAAVAAAGQDVNAAQSIRTVDTRRGLLVVEAPIRSATDARGYRLVLGVHDTGARRALIDGTTAVVLSVTGVMLLMLPFARRRLRAWTTGLGQLHAAIRRMARWEDAKPLAVGGAQEVAYLSIAFNEMAGKVLEGRRALLDANRDLEQRVAQRTEELRLANDQLEQKNDMLAQVTETALRFTDDVAHEFRTPLTVIGEFAAIISDGLGGEVTGKQTEYLAFITDATKDLANLVDDFLDSSKLRSGTLRVDRRPHEVHEIIDSVWPMLEARAQSGGLTLQRSIASDVPTVFADIDKARRALVNLVVNAIKFSRSGSSVRIVASRSEAGGAEISVADQGPGLSPDELTTLFERFRQGCEGSHSTSKGFGLGLNIVRELVDLNLGSVTVKSKVGEGSTFSFSLPPDAPEAIVDCYVARVTEQSSDIAVSIVRAYRDSPAQDCDELQSFLAAELRPADLQLRSGDDHSVLLIREAADSEALCKQLRDHDLERRKANHDERVAPLVVEPVATVPASQARRRILAALLTSTRKGSESHAEISSDH